MNVLVGHVVLIVEGRSTWKLLCLSRLVGMETVALSLLLRALHKTEQPLQLTLDGGSACLHLTTGCLGQTGKALLLSAALPSPALFHRLFQADGQLLTVVLSVLLAQGCLVLVERETVVGLYQVLILLSWKHHLWLSVPLGTICTGGWVRWL
jgi:hypothetical protein